MSYIIVQISLSSNFEFSPLTPSYTFAVSPVNSLILRIWFKISSMFTFLSVMIVSKSVLTSLKFAKKSPVNFPSIPVVNCSTLGIPSAQEVPAPKKKPIFFE